MTVGRKPSTIDQYLKTVPEDRQRALENLRGKIRSIVPAAEECISYGIPAFRLSGVVIAGFCATSKGCSYFPFSGSTLKTLARDLRPLRTNQEFAPLLAGQAYTDCARAQIDQGPHQGDTRLAASCVGLSDSLDERCKSTRVEPSACANT